MKASINNFCQPPRSNLLGGHIRRKRTDTRTVSLSEKYQPGGVRRPPNPFVTLEGGSAMISGCEQCHAVGKPNAMARLAPVPTAIPDTPVPLLSPVSLARADNATWGRITHRSKSMRSPNTASCLPLRKSFSTLP